MRSTKTIALVGFCVLALFLGIGRALVMADQPDRATPTPYAPPEEIAPQGDAPASPDALPDLVVTHVNVFPTTPVVSETVVIQVAIKNQGDVNLPAGNNFFVDLYIDPPLPPQPGIDIGPPTFTWGVQSWYVDDGNVWTLSFSTTFTDTGRHNVYAVIDPTGVVVESDEENNVTGPTQFEVITSAYWQQSSHSDFQKGFSNLDLSHPRGLMQIGLFYDRYIASQATQLNYALQYFDEPEFDREIYFPDYAVITETGLQIAPVMVKGPNATDEVAIVWEDWRNGTTDADIYFSRSTDQGRTWSTPVRITSDADSIHVQRTPSLIYNEACGTYHAVWADNRLGSFDIWHAYSTDNGATWIEDPLPINDLNVNPTADQTAPAIGVDAFGNLFVAWQDRRNGNDDIYFAYGSGGCLNWTWGANVFVTDDPEATAQDQRLPQLSVSTYGNTPNDVYVFIVWQDMRFDGGDIFLGIGQPSPAPLYFTFDIDVQMNTDGTTALQLDPALDSMPLQVEIDFQMEDDNNNPIKCKATLQTNVAHVAWQDYRNGNPDIYYAWLFTDYKILSVIGDDPILCASGGNIIETEFAPFTSYGNVNVSAYTVEPLSNACWGPDSRSAEPMETRWQGEPTVAVANPYQVFIAWSDGRSSDDLNYDIHIAGMSNLTEDATPTTNFTERVGVANVNDNLKRLDLLIASDKQRYNQLYDEYAPAGVRQRRPSLVTRVSNVITPTLNTEWLPFAIAWDDTRYDDSFSGTITNRDIFAAPFVSEMACAEGTPLCLLNGRRVGQYTAQEAIDTRGYQAWGTYISPVFDAGSEAIWFDIQWWGATQFDSSLLLQVRLGNTPTPPLDDVNDGNWTRWSGVGGAGGYYDAPGQNIRDEDGSLFPRYRYAQYRVLINQNRPTTGLTNPLNGACVSQVKLAYEPIKHTVYLPLMLNGSYQTTAKPNDTYYDALQWDMRISNFEAAWAQSRGNDVTIAIVDTGVDLNHPDLKPNLVAGWDFGNNDGVPQDVDGHGTHVAGLAGAVGDNAQGIAGAAWNAKIMPLKVFADGSQQATDAAISAAIQYAADHGADVIHLSVGGPDDSQAIRDAIAYARSKGAVIVAAAGNEYENGNPVIYPAALADVIAVAAVTSERQRASYSSVHSYVDVAAGGGDPANATDPVIQHWVWSTYPTSLGGAPATGYNKMSGTAQAAAHASGLAALLLSRNSALSPDDVATLMKGTADDLGAPGVDNEFGYGLLDAGSAVSSAVVTTMQERFAPLRKYVHVYKDAPDLLRQENNWVPGELLVAYDDATTLSTFDDVLSTYGAKRVEQVLSTGVWLVRVPEGREVAVRAALRTQPGIRYVELNYLRTLQ
nr:S8 family serine peptidase [Ardenticatena sp.]